MKILPSSAFAGFLRGLVAALLLAPLLAEDAPAIVKEVRRSVNGSPFLAYVVPIWQENIVVVRAYDPRDFAEFSLLSKDGQHGRHVENIAWSPDGQFLVFTTSSSGGHSPWNARTWVFSSLRWEFLNLDDAAAAVTSTDFSFPDATHLRIEMLKSDSADADETERRTIDLEALPWKKPKTRPLPAE